MREGQPSLAAFPLVKDVIPVRLRSPLLPRYRAQVYLFAPPHFPWPSDFHFSRAPWRCILTLQFHLIGKYLHSVGSWGGDCGDSLPFVTK